jgi:hypothetical protein
LISVPDNNLLLALHTYASQQDENFTTEAFVHLLRHLQIHEPKIACAFCDFLTDKQIRFEPIECSELEIRTQWSFSGGTPDILIKGPDHFVIVEVKVEAQPGVTQLDRYREQLKKQNERHTCLTLLSRYPVDPNEKVKADACVRWHGVGPTFGSERSKYQRTDQRGTGPTISRISQRKGYGDGKGGLGVNPRRPGSSEPYNASRRGNRFV